MTDENVIAKSSMPIYGSRGFSIEEYIEKEEYSHVKYEYHKGDVTVLDLPKPQHQTIISNIHYGLKRRLKDKDCEVFPGVQRICIPENSFFTYPDLFITCGKIISKDDDGGSVVNPTIIFEVLSPSTMDYDRGMKFSLYQNIPTLKEYILIDSKKVHAQVFSRQPNGEWVLVEYNSINGLLKIKSINTSILMKDVYAWLQMHDNEQVD